MNWDDSCTSAFETLKRAVTSAPILRHADWERPFRGHIDASQTAIAGTLTQLTNGAEHPIAFFSQELTDTEQNYPANDRELLSLVRFLHHLRCYIEGAELEIITGNQVFKNLFSKKSLSRREAETVHTLSNYGISPITLQKGSIHVLGDSLSRLPHTTEEISAFLANIVAVEPRQPIHEDIMSAVRTDKHFGPIMKELERNSNSNSGFCIDYGLLRLTSGELCIPRRFVKFILRTAHDDLSAGHFGFSKTLSRLQDFYWPRKIRDVRNYARGCEKCQRNKIPNQKPYTTPQVLEPAERRWGSVSMDFIVGLPPTSTGYDAITTDDTAVQAVRNFYDTFVKPHGLPDSVVSDTDPKFRSKFWEELMKILGIKLRMSSSRHPQTNGQTEVMNKTGETYLRIFCNYNQDNWDTLLASAEFAYSSSTHDTKNHTPFFLDFGYDPKNPLELISRRPDCRIDAVSDLQTVLSASCDDASRAYRRAREKQRQYGSAKFREPHFSP